jgi:hypothetical protein
MIELAFVSGRRGQALYVENGIRYVLGADGSSRALKAGESGVLAINEGEFEAVEPVTPDILKHLLAQRIREQNALFLFTTLWVCQDFCVNDQVLFLGMGCRGRGRFPFPCPAM